VERVDKKLIPTELGFLVNDLLVEWFSDVVNVDFTADMEEKLDEVATGEQAWVPMLHEFYDPFSQQVAVAQDKMPRVEFKPEPTGELCPQCGEPLLYRRGRRGKFIGCSAFPQCRYTASIPIPGLTCPECGGAVVEKRTRRGRKFYSCANWRPDDETACQWSAWKLPQATKEAERS
jgi:DNA topoisomerase-1